MATLDGLSCWYPQTAYAGLQNSLHLEWDSVQRVTPDIGMDFQGVEYELQNTFLPYIFQGATSHIPCMAITSLPAKQAGIVLPDTTLTKGVNWMASCVITGHLVATLRGTVENRSGNHALLMEEGREEI